MTTTLQKSRKRSMRNGHSGKRVVKETIKRDSSGKVVDHEIKSN